MWDAFWQLSAVGALIMVALMALLWVLHFPLRNASIVDVGWALGLPLLAVTYAAWGPGDAMRSWTMAAMVILWGGRLGGHLALRIFREGREEGRYRRLRAQWKTHVGAKFLAFFQAQALLDVLLAVPFLLVCLDPRPGWSTWHGLGLALWLVAVCGEALADRQLAVFKRDPANMGRVCQTGLWSWSRHPNYFFEWLFWVAVALFASGSPWGWLAWLAPALMLHFILNVTGIPPTEAQALSTKEEAYRAYQRRTSAFFPRPPRERPAGQPRTS